VLEIRIPEVDYHHLGAALKEIAPRIIAYMTSFGIIGLYWVFHHYGLTLVGKVDGIILWLNIIFLLFISFLPFPTILMGRYPFQTLPVIMYTGNLLLVNATGFLLTIYLKRHKHLSSALFTPAIYRSQMKLYMSVNLLYAAAIILALFVPAVSYWVVIGMALLLICRSVVLTKV
jgi:uncharacterized membrane protein